MAEEFTEWRAYFQAPDGTVLVTIEAWDSPEEAAMWGGRIMSAPDEFELADPDGQPVPASLIDEDEGFTVENEENEVFDADELEYAE